LQSLAASQVNAIHIFQTIESMSMQLTAYASGHAFPDDGQHLSSWPLVQFPDWGALASQVIRVTGASYLGFTTLVTDQDRTAYEQFSSQNQEWIQKALNFTKDPFQEDDDEEQIQVSPFIFHFNQDTMNYSSAPSAEVYAPVTQIAPLSKYNTTLHQDSFQMPQYKRVFDGMVQAKQAILSEVLGLEGTGDYPAPVSCMIAPIYDRLLGPAEEARSSSKKDGSGGAMLVGAITGEIPWHSYFSNLVPQGINGMILVVKNTCHQQISYQINGPEVIYLGLGDLHDPAYDHYEHHEEFTAFRSIKECTYTLHIYPSDEFVTRYQTKRPVKFAVSVVLIFVLVSLVFMIYDWIVERRQERILTTANRNDAMIASLFPPNVRQRLMEEAMLASTTTTPNHNNAVSDNTTTSRSNQTRILKSLGGVAQRYGGGEGGGLPVLPFGRTSISSPGTVNTKDSSRPGTVPVFPGEKSVSSPGKQAVDSWLSGIQEDAIHVHSSRPIADLFPQATVLFGDLVGFTAWSSAREPSQVFTLLETVYHSFDTIARKLSVFKVETIGDCYVAATGLPEHQADHALIMIRFARRCLYQLHKVVQQLDRQLGPGTADLAMRFGLHSGPVTAGVLRGEKSRFQLFGDTVNTAARMESTGAANKIHMSQQTADLVLEAGKERWIKAREELVSAKGKGMLQTYWLLFRRPSPINNKSHANSTNTFADISENQDNDQSCRTFGTQLIDSQSQRSQRRLSADSKLDSRTAESNETKLNRLVAWNVDVLQVVLKKIVAMRGDTLVDQNGIAEELVSPSGQSPETTTTTVLDEVQEFITLPSKASTYKRDPATIQLSAAVLEQLRNYVSTIASKYKCNSFHSFGHACHVTQSVMKLLARVVTGNAAVGNDKAKQHEFTFGIASDPVVQFAVAFSAVVHDVDHDGVPNSQLVKEQSSLAARYRNKSVAEQNSVDVAWGLLMEPRFKDLRACIYTNEEERDHFRQLVVNAVMATDVMDKELNALRRKRWDKAFEEEQEPTTSTSSSSGVVDTKNWTSTKEQLERERVNRKATIVIEHLIQASDVAHTMQHWHVYLKWNERLFHEMYHTFLVGRSEVDPSENWYEGELGFFDFYVIPLAQKLKECGVFGVCSEEYLLYALANRREWAIKGKETVQGYLSSYQDVVESA
jgi:class 3 adenylate cyclase